MIKFDIKRLYNWQFITVISLFIASIIGFINFESSLIFKIIFIALVVLLAIYFLGIDALEYFNIIVLFLVIFDCYNLYFSMNIPLWSVMIISAVLVWILAYIFLESCKDKIGNKLYYVYSVLLSLVILEIFLALISWPTDPKSKSMIIVSIFYIFYLMILEKGTNSLNWKKILPYIISVILIIVFVVVTTKWYGY